MADNDIQAFKDDVIEELHRLEGRCGHCGKKDCGGKKSYSTLPGVLKTENVLDVLNRMVEIHKEG